VRLEQEALRTVARNERWQALAAVPRVVMQESHAQYALELARRFEIKALTFMLVKHRTVSLLWLGSPTLGSHSKQAGRDPPAPTPQAEEKRANPHALVGLAPQHAFCL
jgi:hypothetical protein